jgi:hypothetical protein
MIESIKIPPIRKCQNENNDHSCVGILVKSKGWDNLPDVEMIISVDNFLSKEFKSMYCGESQKLTKFEYAMDENSLGLIGNFFDRKCHF